MDSSTVASDVIRLGQIAKISGENKNLLDTLIVANAAPAGHSRFLLKSSIFIPAEIKNTTTIRGADRIRIHSLSQELPFEKLARIATELLADSLINNENIKSEILFEYPKDAKVNIALGDYEVILGKIEAKQLRGRTIIPLIVVQKNGEKRTRVSLNAAVKVTAKVCVASTDIARHEKISTQNLEYKTVDISGLRGTPLFRMPKIDEYQVIGAIRAGMIVTDRHVVPRPVVELGSPVRMTTGEGMVRVTIWGRARSAGGIGDVIVVENTESNKIVRAKVIRSGEVEIVRGGTI
jgi:flagella basal body P-ring formation protein FlgA